MSFEPLDYLRHILLEADYLISSSEGLSYDGFQSDETVQRAFVRSLEVIGEAAERVPGEIRTKHPEVDWRFGVDLELVWEVVQRRVPETIRSDREQPKPLLRGRPPAPDSR